MNALTVTQKGHIVLQQDMLDHLGVGIGNTIIVEKLPDGRIELRASKIAADISQTFGLLKRHGKTALSAEEINDAAARGWAGEP